MHASQRTEAMIVEFLLRGEAESIAMLGTILAPGETSPFVTDDHGHWLAFEVDKTLPRAAVVARFQDSLALATGAMRLWANARGPVKVHTARFHDPETGRVSGVLFDAYSIVAPLKPEALTEPTPSGLPLGAAALDLAAHDPNIGKALSLLASAGSEWWQLYILLEILRDALGTRPNHRSRSWKLAFRRLSHRYGMSEARLGSLKQTMNFHRHSADQPPNEPWRLEEARAFVRTAVRDWLDDLLSASPT